MGRKKARKKKRPNGVASYGNHVPEWKKICRRALHGEYDEQERAIVAKKASMMTAVRHFTHELSCNLNKYNTNLGLLLETRSSVVASLNLEGTGDNGDTEYIPVKLTIQVGPIQELEEHVQALKSGWMDHSEDTPASDYSGITEYQPPEQSLSD